MRRRRLGGSALCHQGSRPTSWLHLQSMETMGTAALSGGGVVIEGAIVKSA
jgi:hypothetical protein